mmetsp:Transcript_12133/g.26524  ORF Transcript_12133/g.26524 Transcript_12133/m.26524 type:complete len:119 (-) Transcript_12133:97-453(-)
MLLWDGHGVFERVLERLDASENGRNAPNPGNDEEENKELVIVKADTVCNERAVMVHLEHAARTLTTVMRTIGLVRDAVLAIAKVAQTVGGCGDGMDVVGTLAEEVDEREGGEKSAIGR